MRLRSFYQRVFWLFVFCSVTVHSANPITQTTLNAELGFLSVAGHTIQFSKSGTLFDYKRSGAQDVLFAFNRLSIDLSLGDRHQVVLLYQPLRLETRETLVSDLSVDNHTYPAGANMRFLYDFPFYRASWLYDFLEDASNQLAVGLSFQIRNATIEFEDLDTRVLRTQRNIGPVPALKVRATRVLDNGIFMGFEADGIYAPVSYLNGSDEEITGAILDASVRGGYAVSDRGRLFLNLRYLGGGAVGTNTDDPGPGDGYVKNWLHFVTVSTGFSISLQK